MRTKTLLVAAAALVAGIFSSGAQTYSGVVGYTSTFVNSNFSCIAPPFDTAGGNSLTNWIPGIVSGQFDNSYIYVWAGTHYTTYFVDSSQGGLNDAGDNGNVASPTINPGTALFFVNANPPVTNTFVGAVHADTAPTGTQTVGQNTNTILNLVFIASKAPVGGRLSTDLQLPTAGGAMDNDYIYIPNIDSHGVIHGFLTYFVDSSLGGSGIADAGDNGLVSPEPSVGPGTGFFVSASSTPVYWVQTY